MSPIDAAPVPVELRGKRVAMLVSGGISAYKAADLASQLIGAGCDVRVAMTSAATRFVGTATFHGLTGHPVQTDVWSQSGAPEPHVALGEWAQVLLFAPATANVLAKIAGGHSDDLCTATVLASRCPVVIAPAMNDAMWDKPAVAANVATLRERGLLVVEPEYGRLASGHVGSGRLPSATAVFEACAAALRARYDMAGKRVLVSAGGTREPIDPVRFISNFSSGKMGHAVAEAAADRGASVVLITTAPPPVHPEIRVCRVETADSMLGALRAEIPGADLLAMVAAVADFRPSARVAEKIHRENLEGFSLELEKNVDILAALRADPAAKGVYMLGFAAEGDDFEARAAGKLQSKGLDAIVGNNITEPGVGFGSDDNSGVIIFRAGERVVLERSSKRRMADRILDNIIPRLQ